MLDGFAPKGFNYSMTVAGFDLRALQYGFKAHKMRGIGVYTKNLISRKDQTPEGLALAPFHDSGFDAEEAKSFGSKPYPEIWTARLRPFLKEYIWWHGLYRGAIGEACGKNNVDIMFFPTHLDVPLGLDAPYAVTAHDMIQAALGQSHYSSVKWKIDFWRQRKILKGARLIICVSHHTRNDVAEFSGAPLDRMVVIPNGVGPEFKPMDDSHTLPHGIPEKYILNVGGIDHRKNVGLLFNAFSKLVDKHPQYHLVMTGDIKGDPQYQSFLGEMKRAKLESRVIAPGFVDQKTLALLYSRASVFFYPSLYEGFGLPVIEAMACGAPVISTNRSSIPEVAGDSAILLDPDDPQSFADALIRLCESDNKRRELKDAGIGRAALFSWDRCATETYGALSAAT